MCLSCPDYNLPKCNLLSFQLPRILSVVHELQLQSISISVLVEKPAVGSHGVIQNCIEVCFKRINFH